MALWYTRLLLITLLAPLAGCAMCACPYDYAGPTYCPSSGEPPYGDYRAGSVLYGGGHGPFEDGPTAYGYQDDDVMGEADERRQPMPADDPVVEQPDDNLLDPMFDDAQFDESFGGTDITDDDGFLVPEL